MIFLIFFCPKPQILSGNSCDNIILCTKHIHHTFPISLLGSLWAIRLFYYIKDRFCYFLIILFCHCFLFWFYRRRIRRLVIIFGFSVFVLLLPIPIFLPYGVAFSILVITTLALNSWTDFFLIGINVIVIFFFILFRIVLGTLLTEWVIHNFIRALPICVNFVKL